MARSNSDVARLVRQFADACNWVGDNPDRANALRKAMNDVVTGRCPVGTEPHTWPARQSQLAKVQEFLRLYGGETGFRPEDALAAQPLAGVPWKDQLLAVYLPDRNGRLGFVRSFDAWLGFAGRERPVERVSDLDLKSTYMRLAEGVEYRPGIRWVRFIKNYGAGKSSAYSREQTAWLNAHLGGLEPLMAVSLLDDYFAGWHQGGNVAPYLSGIEVSLDGGKSWDRVPHLYRWPEGDGRYGLNLDVHSAHLVPIGGDFGSPLVCEW